MYIVWNCCLPIADFETTLLKPVFYLQKMMNFMKMRTFYKKTTSFYKKKNSILYTYKKLKHLIPAFIKIFGNHRDPRPPF